MTGQYYYPGTAGYQDISGIQFSA